MEWEFQAPKFWDLSETIPQERPTDDWFCTKNVSNPSFEAPKKRRTLRIFKYSSKSAAQKKLQEPIQKRESVFERLSRESTISFSRKTNQPLTPHQRQLEAQHLILNDLEDNYDQDLIVQSSKETVGERIARLEGTYLEQGKSFGLGKKTIKLKQKINHSSYKQPAQTQTLYDEIQNYYESEEKTEEAAFSNISQLSPRQSNFSPTRQSSTHTPDSRRVSSDQATPISNYEERVTHIHSPLRREQTKTTLSRIPIQSASPIRKHNTKSNYITPSKVDQVVSNFFEGLLKLSFEREKKVQEAKEAKAKSFFENLYINNTKAALRREIEAERELSSAESLSENNNSKNKLLLSPRKRRISTGGSNYYMSESFKRSRVDLNDS